MHGDRVPPPFEPVLSAVADRLAEVAGEVSLYLHGSAATGAARAGSSDVDLLTVGLPAARAKAVGISERDASGPLCREVELAPAQPEDLGR